MTRRSLFVLGFALLAAASCATPPPPAPHVVTFEAKLSWILSLEDRRVLRDPAPAATAPAGPIGSRTSAAPVPDLLALLGDGDARVRRRAALAAGRVGLAEAVGPLGRLLADPDEEVRQMAAFGLGLLSDRAAIDPLAAALQDTSVQVQGRAAQALGLIGATERANDIAAMARAHVEAGALRALAPDDLTYPMAPPVEAVRLALYALSRLQTYDALASLALDASGQPISRWWPVAYAFGRIGDVRAAPVLTTLLQGEGRYTRAFAARGFGHAKAADAAGVLVPIAADAVREPVLAVEAMRALGALKVRSAAAALLKVVHAPTLEPGVRAEALAALAATGSTGDAEGLLDLLSNRDPGVRAAAFRALAVLDPGTFLTALSGLDPDPHWTVRAAIATGLGTLSAEQGTPLLVRMARESDQRARPAILAALTAIEAPEAERLLLEALSADDAVVRGAAAAALGRLRAPAAVEPLRAAYAAAAKDATYTARGAIIDALARYDRAIAEPALVDALDDKDWAVRVRAASLLAAIDPSRQTAHEIRPAPTTFTAETYESAAVVAPPYSTRVYVETDKGTVELELAMLDAPLTVASFVTLARKGFFDGLSLHRVVPGFVVQDGDPRGDGEGGPGYTIRDEINQRPYLRGTIGMALDWEDTGGSQYFITHGPQPHLDGRHTVFGQVVSGMEVVDRLVQWDVVRRVRVWDGVQQAGTPHTP